MKGAGRIVGATYKRGEYRRDGIAKAMSLFSSVNTETQEGGKYLNALINTKNAEPCVIPDMSCYQVYPFKVEQILNFTLTGPVSAAPPVILEAGMQGFVIALGGDSRIFVENPATSTSAAFSYLADGPLFSEQTQMATRYQTVRLVAASLEVVHSGNDTNNEGLIHIFPFANADGERNVSAENIMANVNAIQNTPPGETFLAKEGAYSYYRPFDGRNLDYKNPLNSATSDYWGGWSVHWQGCSPGTTFQVHVSAIFEGLTRRGQGQTVEQTVVIANDPAELAVSQNVVFSLPASVKGTEIVPFVKGVQKVCKALSYRGLAAAGYSPWASTAIVEGGGAIADAIGKGLKRKAEGDAPPLPLYYNKYF